MAKKVAEHENGVVVYQVTDDPTLKDNIYCERCYCSPDSRSFVYQRYLGTDDAKDRGGPREYVACDFGTWEKRSLGIGVRSRDVTRSGLFYYCRGEGGQARELARVDLATEKTETLPAPPGLSLAGMIAVAPGGRYLACAGESSLDPQMFGLDIVDLEAGTREPIYMGCPYR